MQAPSYELTRCAACGSADAREVASADDVRNEVELLWAFHEKRLRLTTPSARLMDRVAFSERPPLRVVQCTACGLVYRNPAERGAQVAALYASDAPTTDTMRALHAAQRSTYEAQASRLVRTLGRRGTVLEVGSYVGAFLSAARDKGLVAEGVDVNVCTNGFTRGLGFTVHDGDVADISGREYDAVAFWNCFDQLPSPRAAANAAWRLLRPGGVLAIRVPNGGYYARWRSKLGGARGALARELLAQNNLLSFPYRFGFSPSSLGKLLGDIGFTVERTIGDVLVPTADEFTRAWARVEERLVKASLVPLVRRRAAHAPWFELYARRAD